MKHLKILFWIAVACAFFTVSVQALRYDFPYLEQGQVFLDTGAYACGLLSRAGGFSLYISRYLVQFFDSAYAAAATHAGVLTALAACCYVVVRRFGGGEWLLPAALLPSCSLLFAGMDWFRYYQADVSLLMVAAVAAGWVCLPRRSVRLSAGVAGLPFLYFAVGPAAHLLALTGLFYECSRRQGRWWTGIVLPLWTLFLAWAGVRLGWFPGYREALFPAFYYDPLVAADATDHWAWLLFLALPLCGLALVGLRPMRRGLQWAAGVVLLGICAGFSAFIYRKTFQPGQSLAKRLDYYARTAQWDRLIAEGQGSADNYLVLNYLNLALMEQGVLGDRAFDFDQRGPRSLMAAAPAYETYRLLSHFYWAAGDVAQAQRMAFEAYTVATAGGDPTMLKRLVEANLVTGAYPVAGKYIDQLAHTRRYRAWAEERRRFLYNDAAVEQDTVLGDRRRGLPDGDYVFATADVESSLRLLAEHSPRNRRAVECLGVYYLLARDLDKFQALVDRFYGTDRLPVLPRSFQQALLMLHEKEEAKWEHYRISSEQRDLFGRYREAWAQCRNRPQPRQLMARNFARTYYYYYMFKL